MCSVLWTGNFFLVIIQLMVLVRKYESLLLFWILNTFLGRWIVFLMSPWLNQQLFTAVFNILCCFFVVIILLIILLEKYFSYFKEMYAIVLTVTKSNFRMQWRNHSVYKFYLGHFIAILFYRRELVRPRHKSRSNLALLHEGTGYVNSLQNMIMISMLQVLSLRLFFVVPLQGYDIAVAERSLICTKNKGIQPAIDW